MALPSSGAISLQDIQNEFGGSNPIGINEYYGVDTCLLYTSPSPRDLSTSRMPSSA